MKNNQSENSRRYFEEIRGTRIKRILQIGAVRLRTDQSGYEAVLTNGKRPKFLVSGNNTKAGARTEMPVHQIETRTHHKITTHLHAQKNEKKKYTPRIWRQEAHDVTFVKQVLYDQHVPSHDSACL